MTRRDVSRATDRQNGSVLVLALIVLSVLTLMGVTLLFTADADVKMNQAGVRAKTAFYVAEAGLESARKQLRDNNVASANKKSLSDELVAATGANGALDMDPATVKATFDGRGNVTGFAGYGDDAPLVASTAFGGGRYAAFVTNDPSEGRTSLTDANHRAMITAIGAGSSYSSAIVQAVVANDLLPGLPATITMVGAAPHFDGGDSNAKTYTGYDCQGASSYTGVAGASTPVIGVIGGAAVTSAQFGVKKPGNYTCCGTDGSSTVQDVTGTIDPTWTNCLSLQQLAAAVRASADYVCTPLSPCSHWATSTINTITFVDGNVEVPSGKGVLWVTGKATLDGDTSWEGMILVVGKGIFERSGGGNGHTWGAEYVANITGPDGIYATADDCTGGTGGLGVASYSVGGGGGHETVYCSDAINQSLAGVPMRIVDFRQR